MQKAFKIALLLLLTTFALAFGATMLSAQEVRKTDTVYIVKRVYERQPQRPGCRHSTPQFCNGWPGGFLSNYDPYRTGALVVAGLTVAELTRPGGIRFSQPRSVARHAVRRPPVDTRSRGQRRPELRF